MIKQNINKIHYDITNEFEVVTLSEKFNRDLGSYIEISITEGKKEVKLTLKKTEVEKNSFDWSYLSNPLVESSDLVYRTSTVLEFSRDIKDIFEKNRFDSDYLEEIKKKNDINENKALSQTSVTSRLCTLELNYNTEVDLKLAQIVITLD